jgi:hypothetical protein
MWPLPATRRTVALALVLGVVLVGLVSLAVLGAEPTQAPRELLSGGDPRTEGGGPGIVGSPIGVLLGVVALGLATTLVTVVLARLAHRP